jgi:acyl-[acyl carrier protein]--UDP-N-acetylglucosamine O-acyltransferase
MLSSCAAVQLALITSAMALAVDLPPHLARASASTSAACHGISLTGMSRGKLDITRFIEPMVKH